MWWGKGCLANGTYKRALKRLKSEKHLSPSRRLLSIPLVWPPPASLYLPLSPSLPYFTLPLLHAPPLIRKQSVPEFPLSLTFHLFKTLSTQDRSAQAHGSGQFRVQLSRTFWREMLWVYAIRDSSCPPQDAPETKIDHATGVAAPDCHPSPGEAETENITGTHQPAELNLKTPGSERNPASK